VNGLGNQETAISNLPSGRIVEEPSSTLNRKRERLA
jgi:hypothetical protein